MTAPTTANPGRLRRDGLRPTRSRPAVRARIWATIRCMNRRVYVSLPADRWLPDNINALKWAIVEKIENIGYTPEVFADPKGKAGLASPRTWSAQDADEVARRCAGAALLGMPRWRFTDNGRPVPAADRVQSL